MVKAAPSGRSVSPQSLLFFGAALLVVGWPVRVLVHEFGHSLALFVFGHEGVWMRVGLYSGWTAWTGDIPEWQHVVVSLSGTLLVCLVSFALVRVPLEGVTTRRFLQFVAVLWVASEFVNMTPMWNTDGNYLATVWGKETQSALLLVLAAYAAYLFFEATHDRQKLHVKF